MSIRTAEQLSDRLSTDLAWRKKELSELKSLVESRNVSPQRHSALIRSGICIREHLSYAMSRNTQRASMREYDKR